MKKILKTGNEYSKNFINQLGSQDTIIISAEIEKSINKLEKDDKKSFMELLKIKETGLDTLISKRLRIT